VLAPLKAADDLPTQGRARAGSVSSRISTVFSPHCVQAGHTDVVFARRRRHCRGRLAVCSASRRRRRQPQEPGPQPPRLDARASAVQRPLSSPLPASRPTSRPSGCGSRRSQPRALSSWRARRRSFGRRQCSLESVRRRQPVSGRRLLLHRVQVLRDRPSI
jgi:hypothetical protein